MLKDLDVFIEISSNQLEITKKDVNNNILTDI